MINSRKFFILFALCNTLFSIQYNFAQSENTQVGISRFDQVASNVTTHRTLVDKNNVYWLATSQGLIETNSEGSRYQNHLEQIEILDVVADNKGQIWAISQNKLFNVATNESYTLPNDSGVANQLAYYEGSFWIATDNGLVKFLVFSSKMITYTTKNSALASNQINFVHADANNILWIGTENGYIRMDGDKWNLKEKKDKMLATYENIEGQWILSNKDLFLINKYNRLFPVKLDKTQYKGKVKDFTIDSKGKIYIASDILASYDPYTEFVVNYSSDAALLSKSAISLNVDQNDNVWIGTQGGGFYKLQFGDLISEKLNVTCLITKSISCEGNQNGALYASVSGGKGPFRYMWNKGEQTKSRIEGLSAGMYEITVIDSNDSTVVSSVELKEPTNILIGLIENNRITNSDKPDGSLKIEVTGGAGNYTFLWSNGQKTQNLFNLTSGLYTVQVKDKNGCLASAEYIIKREKILPDLEIGKVTIGQKLRINELNFDADSSIIAQSNYDVLNEVFEFLNFNKDVRVEIGGHTNTIPSDEYCDKLSSDRARNVAEYLIKSGISSDRVAFKGYGKREPLTDSVSLQGRQKNQRVEIKILSI